MVMLGLKDLFSGRKSDLVVRLDHRVSDWIEAMMLPGNHGDSYALQVAANLLGRDIIIVPSNKMSAHNPYGYILVESCIVNANPLFLFYYEEHIYDAGHYQSIMPIHGKTLAVRQDA